MVFSKEERLHNSVVAKDEALAANKRITQEHRTRARRILGAYIYPNYLAYPRLIEHEERVLHHLEQGCAEEYRSDELVASAAVVLAYADTHWARYVGTRYPTAWQLKVLLRASKIVITIAAARLIDVQDRRMTMVTASSVSDAAQHAAQRLAHQKERLESFLTDTWGRTLAHGV